MSEKSTHIVEVVPVKLEPHPNADSFSIVRVWDYTVCARTEDWKNRAFGAYIPPDSLVDTSREEFAFLREEGKSLHRVKAKRLRGVWSQGLLVPAPEGASIGDDVTEALGVTHYDPPEPSAGTNADSAKAPKLRDSSFAPIYDVDSGYKFARAFEEGEEICASEKLHGSNSRFLYSSLDGEFHMGTHYRWVIDDNENMWSRAVAQNPWIRDWCVLHPDVVVYAEVIGNQDLKYGFASGHYGIRVFDLMKNGNFLDLDEARELGKELLWVPIVYRGPFNLDHMKEICNGPSLMPGANHIREGIVVKPIKERWNERCGRVNLKFVSPAYLERSK